MCGQYTISNISKKQIYDIVFLISFTKTDEPIRHDPCVCVWLFITVLGGYFFANFHGFSGEEINSERVVNIYCVNSNLYSKAKRFSQ